MPTMMEERGDKLEGDNCHKTKRRGSRKDVLEAISTIRPKVSMPCL